MVEKCVVKEASGMELLKPLILTMEMQIWPFFLHVFVYFCFQSSNKVLLLELSGVSAEVIQKLNVTVKQATITVFLHS